MHRRTVIAAVVVVGAAVVAGAACAKKAAPGESPATAKHGGPTVPGALHGQVRSGDGTPVVGALVQAVSVEEPQRAVPEIAVVTDGDGRYEWPLAPGRYRLSVDTPAGSGSGEVEVRAGGTDDLDMVVAP